MFEIKIFKMISLLRVREVQNSQYKTLKYLVISYYFLKIDTFKNIIFACARRKIHVIDELRVNILIENDFIDLKKNFINIVNQKVYIENYKISIIIIARQRE